MKFEGFSYEEIISELKKRNISFITGEEIKEHTVKKIEYMKKYVEQWLYVLSNVSNNIYFIDVMSNAGLYKNNHLTTCIEVLNVYAKFAQYHQDKMFYLLTNDLDSKRVENLKKIFDIYKEQFDKYGIKNIKMEFNNSDASDFVKNLIKKFNNQFISVKTRSILLYVDPYNFISYNLANAVHDFTRNVYCEVILNYDIQDYIRNINNDSVKQHQEEIKYFVRYFCNLDCQNVSAREVMNVTMDKFTQESKINYKYSIEMKNSKNVALYHLIYFTPNLRGLEKVKDATWKVFGFHDNYSSKHIDRMQPNLFGETDETNAYDNGRKIVADILCSSLKKSYSYNEILVITFEKTIFPKGKVISDIIKPLIEDRIIIKQNLKGIKNYTEDLYSVVR